MLRREEWVDINSAYLRGVSIKEISRTTGLSRNTVRKTVRSKTPLLFRSPPSKLDPFKEYLIARLAEYPGLTATKLFDEIKALGYRGQLSILKDFTLPYRRVRKNLSNIRFETAPGHQAQVDWVELGYHKIAGIRQRLSLFVMVLGYSRMMYACLCTDETEDTFINCHKSAFAYFGGLTEEILYDNAKVVAIKHDRDGVVFNKALLDFAFTYGFTPRVCRPARPQTKGKVERAVRYIRDSFLEGESFAGISDMQLRLLAWLDNVANVRIHQSTGVRPIDLLLKEELRLPRQLEKPVLRPAIIRLDRSHSFMITPAQLQVSVRDLSCYERAIL